MKEELQTDISRWLAVAFGVTIAVVVVLWLVRGCGHGALPPSVLAIPEGKECRFVTAAPAPDQFEAWSFFWEGRRRNTETEWEMVIHQPDGEVYWGKNLSDIETTFSKARSDFGGGPDNADLAVFHGKPIEVIFRVVQGEAQLASPEAFRFEFFRENSEGGIDWENPASTIPAVNKTE
jgi:hypothetical protein